MARRTLQSASALALTFVAACGADTPAGMDAARPDAGSDAGVDAPHADGRSDVAVDVRGDVPRDAVFPDARDGSPVDARDVASPDAPADTGPTRARSVFFPPDWLPVHAGGATDAQGRALPDFAYAGYRQGVQSPPFGAGTIVATVPSSAGDARTDATSTVQSAIDTACAAGGGVVAIPAGTYRLTFPSSSARAALEVRCSNLVVRGAGRDATRLWLDDPTHARDRALIAFRGQGALYDYSSTTTYALTADALAPTRTLVTAGTGTLAPGDYIAIRQSNTAAFRADHRMDPATSGLDGLWPDPGYRGVIYPRRIVALVGGRIDLDGPTHEPLRTRDAARVYAIGSFLHDVGLESLSLGMTENTTSPITEPGSDDAYNTVGTAAYEVHASRAVEFDRVRDGWAYDVATYRPDVNTDEVHVLSTGILVGEHSFRITVQSCALGYPQYRGGGGNGYLIHVQGYDALVRDTRTDHARHGFIINNGSSGVVFLRDTAADSRYADDSHRYLAHANLYDGLTLEGDWLQSVNRGTTSGGAGFTGTQHVFWNTRVTRNHPTAQGCAVESAQWGYGYLLGSLAAPGATARLCPTSFTNSGWAALDQGAPADAVESEGALLEPDSLYEAQLALRCAREGISCR